MPFFDYTAFDTAHKQQKGQIEAESERSARALLREKKLLLISLNAAAVKNTQRRVKRRVPSKDIALFTQQFAALVQSNIPLEESLRVVAEQTRNKNLKLTLQEIRAKVLEGYSVGESMREHATVFSPIFQALVKAGEQTGELSQVLLKLAEHTARSQKLRNTVVQATVYPLVLTIVAFSIISLLMAFVIPKVVAQFEGTGQDLPLITKIMISCSDFILDYGLWIACFAVVLTIIWRVMLKNENFLLKVHRFLFKTPHSWLSHY